MVCIAVTLSERLVRDGKGHGRHDMSAVGCLSSPPCTSCSGRPSSPSSTTCLRCVCHKMFESRLSVTTIACLSQQSCILSTPPWDTNVYIVCMYLMPKSWWETCVLPPRPY